MRAQDSEDLIRIEAVSSSIERITVGQIEGWQIRPSADQSTIATIDFRLTQRPSPLRESYYLEVSYLDIGSGTIAVDYATTENGKIIPSHPVEDHWNAHFSNRGSVRTATFRLRHPQWSGDQPSGADLRLNIRERTLPTTITSIRITENINDNQGSSNDRDRKNWFDKEWIHVESTSVSDAIDSSSMYRKVLCGYQGWFRCPGDQSGLGWKHWSKRHDKLEPRTLSFDMWPDLSDLSEAYRYPAPGFSHPGGEQAYLYSSEDQHVVDMHFRWMKQFGIDGVLAQRFLVETRGISSTRVLGAIRKAAAQSGRVFAVEYDLSGAREEEMYDRIVEDWKMLIDQLQITRDKQYLHEKGLPVLGIWGFYPDRFDAKLAHRLLDFFQQPGPYQCYIVGGCPHHWRKETNQEWKRAFLRLDVISPWNVGNIKHRDGFAYANTDSWKLDKQLANENHAGYLPVIYPGFSWDHLQNRENGKTKIDRLGGKFLWKQFQDAKELGADFVKVAMFDEVDEGTAIYKVSNTPPVQSHFVTFDGLPSDWYLTLTGLGTRLIRGEQVDFPSP